MSCQYHRTVSRTPYCKCVTHVVSVVFYHSPVELTLYSCCNFYWFGLCRTYSCTASPCSCSLKKKNQSSVLPEIAPRRRKGPSAVSNSMQFIPRGVVIIQFTSSPLFFSSKRLVVRSTRNYALSWKALEGAATFGAGFDLCPIAEFSSRQFGLFPFLLLATARRNFGTFENFSES